MVILTDGHVANLGWCREKIEDLRKKGVKSVGLGIESEYVFELLPETSRNVNDIGKLPDAFKELVDNLIIKGRAK
jgi:hypothetical protein